MAGLGGKNHDICLKSDGFIVDAQQESIKQLLLDCMVGVFSPASLKACIEEQLRLALPYSKVYNFVRKLVRRGLTRKVGPGHYELSEKFFDFIQVGNCTLLTMIANLLNQQAGRLPRVRSAGWYRGVCRVRWRVHVRGSARIEDYAALRFVYGSLRRFNVLGLWRSSLKRRGWKEGELRRIDSFVASCIKRAVVLGWECNGHGVKGLGEGQPLYDVYGAEEHGCDVFLLVPSDCLQLFKHVKMYVDDVLCEGGEGERRSR